MPEACMPDCDYVFPCTPQEAKRPAKASPRCQSGGLLPGLQKKLKPYKPRPRFVVFFRVENSAGTMASKNSALIAVVPILAVYYGAGFGMDLTRSSSPS